jgi:hypothetical protein
MEGDGVTMIAGAITTRLHRQRGVVLVSPGTLFTTGPWPVVLMDDGSFVRVDDDADPPINAFDERGHLQLTPRGTFVTRQPTDPKRRGRTIVGRWRTPRRSVA